MEFYLEQCMFYMIQQVLRLNAYDYTNSGYLSDIVNYWK